MKKVDFILQILIALSALTAYLTYGKSVFAYVALAQFIMGCWQVAGSIITYLSMNKQFKQNLNSRYFNYWTAVVIYFAIIFLFNLIAPANPEFDLPFNLSFEGASMAYVFGLPWIIAIYYMYLTYLTMLQTSYVEQHNSITIF